ncbi:MAG TPA: hypothetical protein VNW97_12765 [Candidatus Saccharimonadales bacterium]|jgi:hypothetical protein|nr:hypothetical protein [Candidatus Saccharimonadales bacterium]
MLKFTLAFVYFAAMGPAAQQDAQPKPQVRVNYLNVCGPSADEQAVLNSALAKVAAKPVFAEDFEMSRGRTAVKEMGPSRFVRLRREYPAASPLLTVQYSMSFDNKTIVELLVLRMRDPKELHEIAIEDRVASAAVSPAAVIASDTPAARIRVERLGKPSVVLARCDSGDQSAYEPIFKLASDTLARYRAAMGLRTSFRSDIAWLIDADKPASTPRVPKNRKQP